jgi:hypothetical protein
VGTFQVSAGGVASGMRAESTDPPGDRRGDFAPH